MLSERGVIKRAKGSKKLQIFGCQNTVIQDGLILGQSALSGDSLALRLDFHVYMAHCISRLCIAPSSKVGDECKPLIFKEGVRVMFPPPTKSIRPPRAP